MWNLSTIISCNVPGKTKGREKFQIKLFTTIAKQLNIHNKSSDAYQDETSEFAKDPRLSRLRLETLYQS